MDNNFILEDINNATEGDVESQVLLPFLSSSEPIGLGYPLSSVSSKKNLRKFLIGKGNKSQNYIPDFIISIDGIPLIVIEAKKPFEDLDEAYREAALYAGEMNRKFDSKVNPCEHILVSDGVDILLGKWDSGTPDFKINRSNWNVSDVNFGKLIEVISFSTLKQNVSEIKQNLRSNITYKNPLNLLGGKYIKDKSISNAFGESISIQYQHLFNASEESERKDIVENAYVKIVKHQSHIAPIDRLIRKKIHPSVENSIEIEDHENPHLLVDKIKNIDNYNNQVLLLIGSVGSGKSTFVTYLKEVALDKEIAEKTVWIRLDLNNTALTKDEIYSWIKNSIIEQLKLQNDKIDFATKSFIEKLYSENIQDLKKGVLSFLDEDSADYKRFLVENIFAFQKDIDLTLRNYIKCLVHDQGKNLVVVLDNCDKRTLDDQLLMFSVANWIKDNIKAIVFLPLRDTTFDLFRNKQPLDTVIKDMTFRINPPSLKDVIYERIKYANRLSVKSNDKYYFLSNGWKVSYPSQDELSYLRSILSSLFQNNFFKQLIAGLAGRDIRKGIEIFLEFCKSGHINDQEILKMKQTKGVYSIPPHIVARVFMRGNRLYYSSNESRIKNIFYLEPNDDLPDPFIRISILKWLYDKRKINGASGIFGFFKVSDLVDDLTKLGHSNERLMIELNYLLQSTLIMSESQGDTIDKEDLISIDFPGYTHLNMIKHVDYLAACSEDFWYRDAKTAEDIANNMAGQGLYSHMSMQNAHAHALYFVEFLREYYETFFKKYIDLFSKNNEVEPPCNFELLEKTLITFKEKISFDNFSELTPNCEYAGVIVGVFDYGIICKVNNSEHVGLVSNKNLEHNFEETSKYGDSVRVKTIRYNSFHKKYDFILIENLH